MDSTRQLTKVELITVLILLICSFPLLAADPSYTIDLWPYGVVAWVQEPPQEPQTIIDAAVHSVQEVFAFWGLPVPKPAPDWDTWTLMDEQAWSEGYQRPLYAGFVPIPDPDSSAVWAIALPEALGQERLPLILVVTPDEDTLQRLFVIGYDHVAFWPGRANDAWWHYGESCHPTALRARSSGMLINSSQPYLSFVMDFEVSQWLLELLQAKGEIAPDILRLAAQGIPRLTAYAFGDPAEREDWAQRSDAVASLWLELFGLSKVPVRVSPWLSSSLVAFLVEQNGTSGCLENLLSFSDDKSLRNSPLTAAWEAKLAARPLTKAEEAYAIQEVQLYPLLHVLSPITSPVLRRTVSRISALNGVPDDVLKVWQEATRMPAQPSQARWTELQQCMDDFAKATVLSAEITPLKDSTLITLLMERVTQLWALRTEGDWSTYFSVLIDTLRHMTVCYAGPTLRGWN